MTKTQHGLEKNSQSTDENSLAEFENEADSDFEKNTKGAHETKMCLLFAKYVVFIEPLKKRPTCLESLTLISPLFLF